MSKRKKVGAWKKKVFADGHSAALAGHAQCCPRAPMGGATMYHLWMDGYNTGRKEMIDKKVEAAIRKGPYYTPTASKEVKP